MKKKILIVIVLLILLIVGVISIMKGKGKRVELDVEDVSKYTPEPFGQIQYDGTIYVYFENKTGENVDKISIISYGADNNVLSTTELSGDEIEEDENNVIRAVIPDDKDAKWDLTFTISGIEYKIESLVDGETIRNQALVPFSIENNKLVVEKDESFVN